MTRLLESWRAFFAWWTGELNGIWQELRARFWPHSRTVLQLDGGRAHEGLAGTLPRPPFVGRELHVHLPASYALARQIVLPTKASRRLAAALELQYTRLMPLPRGDVLLSHRVISQDARGLTVELAILRRTVAEAIGRLGRSWGARTVRIAVATGDSTLPLLSFHTVEGTRSGGPLPHAERMLRAVAVVLAVLMALTGALGWVVHDREMQAQIAAIEPKARAASALAAQLREREVAARWLEQLLPRPDFVQVLAELTKVLPDEAWIFQLTRSGYHLRVSGVAARSSELALKLEGSPMFRNVTLGATSSVGTDAMGRFDLSADIEAELP